MGTRSARCFALLSFGWAMLVTDGAGAGSMDPALERLVIDPECRAPAGEIEPQASLCRPDRAAFTRLVNQFATAFAPTALNPARTLGIAGFQVSLEGSFTAIDSDAEYWKSGTRGSSDQVAASGRNDDPSGILQLYSLRLRKGFGGGVEVAGQFGFMPQTSFLSGGIDARWAVLEGFRKRAWAYLPDVSLGGGVRTTTGSAQMQLTVAAADLRLSKPIALRDEVVLTPWAGLQYLWIFGEPGMVEMTPGTDAADHVRFDEVRLRRPRVSFGGNVHYDPVSFSAQVLVDLTAPHQGQSSDAARAALRGESRQWGFALDAGVRF